MSPPGNMSQKLKPRKQCPCQRSMSKTKTLCPENKEPRNMRPGDFPITEGNRGNCSRRFEKVFVYLIYTLYITVAKYIHLKPVNRYDSDARTEPWA